MDFRDFNGEAGKESFIDFNEDSIKAGNVDKLLFISNYINRRASDYQGKYWGKIVDFLFSKNSGQVEYALIEAGKSLWKGIVTIPISLLEFRGGYEPILINANPEKLKNAPIFSKNTFQNDMVSHYDVIATYWGGKTGIL